MEGCKGCKQLDFNIVTESIKGNDEVAYKWLMDNDQSTWSCHTFDTFFKSDIVTDNISELWNEMLNDYRKKLVIVYPTKYNEETY